MLQLWEADTLFMMSRSLLATMAEIAYNADELPNAETIRRLFENTDWSNPSQAAPAYLKITLLMNAAADQETTDAVNAIINETDWSGPQALPAMIRAQIALTSGIDSTIAETADSILASTNWEDPDLAAFSETELHLLLFPPQNELGRDMLIRDTLLNHPLSLQYFSDDIRSDPVMVGAAIEGDPMAFQYATGAARTDRDLILNLLENNHGNNSISAFIPPELWPDPEIALEALACDPSCWQNIPDTLTRDALFCRKAAFAVLNIDHPTRLMNPEEIIRNRYSVASEAERTALEGLLGTAYFEGADNDDRPLCVIIYPDEDGNGAMTVTQTDMLSEAYRVVYYDVSTDEELVNSIRQATVDAGQQADLLLLTSHGNSNGMYMYDSSDEGSFTLDDTELSQRLQGCVEDNGHVVLQSCSTGEGKDPTSGIDNFAEFVHSIWPNAWTHAPTGVEWNFILLDRNGEFVSPMYMVFDSPLDSEFVIPPDGHSSFGYYLSLAANSMTRGLRHVWDMLLKGLEFLVKAPETAFSLIDTYL